METNTYDLEVAILRIKALQGQLRAYHREIENLREAVKCYQSIAFNLARGE